MKLMRYVFGIMMAIFSAIAGLLAGLPGDYEKSIELVLVAIMTNQLLFYLYKMCNDNEIDEEKKKDKRGT